MKNPNLFLPGFHLATLRRRPRSASQRLADQLTKIRQNSISQLAHCFTGFIPSQSLQPHQSGTQSRQRIFSKENTFRAFFSQILNADGGCSEVVRQFHAFAASRNTPLPSTSTLGYCQARSRLDESDLVSIQMQTSNQITEHDADNRFQGRRVVVADGTGISMPDTPENQREWPQTRQQKPGCGFPQAYICACFNLHSGVLLSHQLGNKKSHELLMLREQWDTFNEGDIFLADKGFVSYYDVFKLLDKGIVYNCLRLLMLKAAIKAEVPIRLIRFKASVQALRQWEPLLQSELSAQEQNRLLSLLCDSIAASVLHSRPGRREPRCKKRRPENFQRMTKSRHEMQEALHRSQYRAEGA